MKVNQTNLFLIVIAVFLQLPRNDASCTFTETARKTGQISYVMIRNFTTKTRDNCKQWCVSRDTCVAVDYTPDACFMFYAKPPLEDNPAGIHYDKTCEPDVCTMVTRLTDTKGTSSSMVKVAMSSVEDCRGICKYLGDCEAVSYTNGICSVYNGVIPTMETDSVDYHKVNCSNGNRCCMDKTSDKKANASAVLSFSQTVESCETACLNYDNCEAVHYKNNVCYFHLTIPNKFAETGSTLSVKSCDPGAPDGTANITDSCPETENLAASGGPKRETLGTDGVPSTDTRLPGENRTGRLSMASGTQKKKKIRKRALFSADASCTFTETARKIGDNSKIKDYIDGGKTKDDCKQWCLSLNNCVAVDHKEGYCFLFEETPVLEDNPAGTHYDKTCTPETTTTTTELTTTVTTTTEPTTSVATTTEPTTSAYASCTFTETARKIGDNSKIKDYIDGGKTKDDCKQWCLSLDNCVAVDHKEGYCFLFEETPVLEDNPAGTHYDKTCTPETTTTTTELTTTVTTTTEPTTSVATTTEPTTSAYASCTFTETARKIGDNSKIKDYIDGGKTKDDCKQWCLSLDNCVAVDHKEGYCFLFEETPVLEDNPAGTHYDKTCTPETTTTTTELTTTVTTTTEPTTSVATTTEPTTSGTTTEPTTTVVTTTEPTSTVATTEPTSTVVTTEPTSTVVTTTEPTSTVATTTERTSTVATTTELTTTVVTTTERTSTVATTTEPTSTVVTTTEPTSTVATTERTSTVATTTEPTSTVATTTEPTSTVATTERTSSVATTSEPTSTVATTTEPTSTVATTTEPTSTVVTTTEPTSTVATTTEPTSTVATTTEPTSTVATTTEPTTMPVDGSADKMADIRKLLESNPAVVAAVAVASVSLLAFCVFLACFIRKRKRALKNKSETDDSLISANGKNDMTELPGYYSPPITSGVAGGISREKRHIPYQCHVDPMIDFHRRKLGYFSNEAYTFSLDHIIPRVALGGKKS